jgi:hypothetical protein
MIEVTQAHVLGPVAAKVHRIMVYVEIEAARAAANRRAASNE